MIDALILGLGALLGAWSCLLAWSAWRLFLGVVSLGLLLGALARRRVALVAASAAVSTLSFLSALLAFDASRLWQACAFGVALLALVEVSWDRVRMVSARVSWRAYTRRLSSIALAGFLASAGLLAAATLGYNTAILTGLSVPFVVAVAAIALTVAGAAAVAMRVLRSRASPDQEER